MWLAEQHGVSLTAATKVGSQPIHIACIRGQLEVVKWLAEQHGVSLMTENNDGLQPIHYACSNRHLKVVKWLAARDGVSLTAEAKNGSQPIHVACQGGHLELVKWLQQHYEVSLTAEAHNGWQPIHSACFNGHLEVVKWLADEDGVSLTAEDNDGSQPIHCACDNGHLEVVKWLAQQDGGKCGGLELDEATGCLVHLWEMEDGVSLMAENNDGWQPIHYACSNGHLEVVKWLAARDGVSLTAEDNDGWQPIHYACSNGHLEVVKWLAQQDGVSLMAEDNDGLQPIHYAGDLELVKWLAEQDGVSLPYPMNQGHEWPLFILRTAAITTYIIPFILGQKPSTTPVFDKVKFAVKMIAERKLDPNYYPSQRALADALGEANKFAIDMKFLFVERFRAKELSLLLGMDVYKPSDGMSGVFNLEITPELTLTAPLDGVTPNRDCVVLINKYYKFANGRVRNELKCVITGVMAVWRARRGIVVLDKTKEVLDFKFEPEFWKVISDRLKTWARQKSMLIREEAKRQGKSGLSEDMLRAAGLDRPLPARNDDERTVTSISTTLSQVSVNECMHASERAVERQIRTSDIQNAKKSGVIWLQIPFNYENDTDAEGTRAENTIQDWGRRLVEAFGLTRKFGLTLGSCLCRGNAQDRRFELELAGSESQGKNIKEWLKDESYFECGRRMQYAWRQNDWELVVVEGQIDLEPESRYSEEVVVGVITSMWRQIHDTGQENCHRHIAAAVGIRNGGSAEAGGVEEAGADVHEDYQLLSDSQKQGQSEYKKQGPQYGHVSLAAPKGGGGRDKAAEKAGRPAQASQATRGPALPAHVVRMMQDWSWEGKALRR
jgi:ankyrin repeat protein